MNLYEFETQTVTKPPIIQKSHTIRYPAINVLTPIL